MALCGVTGQASAQATDGDPKRWFVEGQLHSTFVSALLDLEPLQLSFGAAVRVARRRADLGWYLSLDTTWWATTELDESSEDVFDGEPQGIAALSLGIEHPYFHGRMRFMFDAGVSVMLRETTLDRRGRVGIVTSFRPVGIRIPLTSRRTLVIDPLSLSLLIPDTTGIPLLLIQFRTVFALEFGVVAP